MAGLAAGDEAVFARAAERLVTIDAAARPLLRLDRGLRRGGRPGHLAGRAPGASTASRAGPRCAPGSTGSWSTPRRSAASARAGPCRGAAWPATTTRPDRRPGPVPRRRRPVPGRLACASRARGRPPEGEVLAGEVRATARGRDRRAAGPAAHRGHAAGRRRAHLRRGVRRCSTISGGQPAGPAAPRPRRASAASSRRTSSGLAPDRRVS